MFTNSLTQIDQEISQELVELNNNDLDIVVGGQANQHKHLHKQKTQTHTKKFHEIDKFTRQTKNGYEVGTRDISYTALETITSYV